MPKRAPRRNEEKQVAATAVAARGAVQAAVLEAAHLARPREAVEPRMQAAVQRAQLRAVLQRRREHLPNGESR